MLKHVYFEGVEVVHILDLNFLHDFHADFGVVSLCLSSYCLCFDLTLCVSHGDFDVRNAMIWTFGFQRHIAGLETNAEGID